MRGSLGSIARHIVLIAALLGSLLLFAIFIRGGIWVAAKMLPVLLSLSVVVFAFNILICLPLTFFDKAKHFSGKALFLSSYFYGTLLWLGCLVITFNLWGWVGIIIGLILLGIGVVPIAILAAALAGLWPTVGHIILLIVLMFITRRFGTSLLSKCVFINSPTEDLQNDNSIDDVIDIESKNVKEEDEEE